MTPGAQADCLSGSRRYCLSLLFFLALGVLARIYHFDWTIGNDDQRWIIAARELGNPLGTVPAVYYTRIIWSLTLHLWGALFGPTLESSAVLMFLLSCASIVLVAQSGRLLFGSIAGLLAAGFYALHPVNVVQDVMTLPDGLANAILAGHLFLFLLYLRDRRLIYLALSALLVGVSMGAKDYYVLAAVPMGLCLLLDSKLERGKLVPLLVFGGFVSLGLSIDLGMHLWQSGTPMARFAGADYAERLTLMLGPPSHDGLQHLVRVIVERFRYLEWLLLSYGSGPSVLTAWGLAYLLAKGRRIEHLAVAGSFLIMLGFLMFMPVSLDPLRFVEMQPRYLMILMPLLAIASGGALSAGLAGLRGRAVRNSLSAALGIGMLGALTIPNDYSHPAFRRSSVQEFQGIRQVLENATQYGLNGLLLAEPYSSILPDSYYGHGVSVQFFPLDVEDHVTAVRQRLQGDEGLAIFIPRTMFAWPLAHELRRGEYVIESEVPEQFRRLVNDLESHSFVPRAVRVPASVTGKWLAELGVVSGEQQLIGWVYGNYSAAPE